MSTLSSYSLKASRALIALGFSLFAPAIQAIENEPHAPVRVLTQEVEVSGGNASREQGFFDEVWELLSRGGPAQRLEIVPIKRRQYIFLNDKKSCMYPAQAVKDIKKAAYKRLQSSLIMKMNTRLYSQPNAPLIHSFADLENKIVSHPEHPYIQSLITVPYEKVVISSLESRIQMLLNKRVDAVMISSPPADLYIRSKGIKDRLYDPTLNIMVLPITLTCNITPQNQWLIDVVNKNIEYTRENGSMKALFKSYELDYEEFRVTPEDVESFQYYPAK